MSDRLVPDLVGAAFDTVPGGPLLGVLGKRLASKVIDEWQANYSTALRVAVACSGVSREDLADLLEREPKLAPLFIRVLYAVGKNGHDPTVRVLGTFLGEALADLSVVDDVSLMMAGVENLTEHHVRVLELIESRIDHVVRESSSRPSHWTPALLASASSMRRELVLVAVQGLLASGFISERLASGGPNYGDLETGGMPLELTDMGVTLLRVMRAVAEA